MIKPPIVDITHPLILKNGELYFLCNKHGQIEPAPQLGLGLFYRDCRFLSRYDLRLGDQQPTVLMHTAARGFLARFELTNPGFSGLAGPVASHSFAISRYQILDEAARTLFDCLSWRNCTLDAIAFELRVALETHFEDLLELRGAHPKRRGQLCEPVWDGEVLRFRYDGADGIGRILEIRSTPPAATAVIEARSAELVIPLRIAAQCTIDVDFALRVTETAPDALPEPMPAPVRSQIDRRQSRLREQWLAGYARVLSDDRRFDSALERSLADLQLLTIERDGLRFAAAGVPWFAALFGRDSLAPALQYLAYRPELAAHTLRALARQQGTRYDPSRHEQPGKIMHELRVGEMAHLEEVSQYPGYGSVDSTMLYLITMGYYAQLTGSTQLFEQLRDSVERALEWMDRDGDSDGDGYIEYDNGTEGQPANQGWKDSGDAVSYPDGELVRGRVALAEVQGYAYLAKRLIAGLYKQIGEYQREEQLLAETAALQRRFNRDFWMEQRNCYCMALDGKGRQVAVISSNPGQVLWSGIADANKAQATADRLMAPDMFAGWGIRTLSDRERRFNPIGYHTGSVWPFDNSLICAGFRRYGRDDLALRIFEALLEATSYFDYHRLPEFLSGVARQPDAGPARCPRADPLQAWSSGALPYMLIQLLGLQPDGFRNRLRVVRPILPDKVKRLEIQGLRVGAASLGLRFEQCAGKIDVAVLSREGTCELEA